MDVGPASLDLVAIPMTGARTGAGRPNKKLASSSAVRTGVPGDADDFGLRLYMQPTHRRQNGPVVQVAT